MYQIRDFPYLAVPQEVFFPGASCQLELPATARPEDAHGTTSHHGPTIALFSTTGSASLAGLDDLHPIGVLAQARDGGDGVEYDIVQRVRLRDLARQPHPIAQVELLREPVVASSESEAELDAQLRQLAHRLFQRAGQRGRQAIAHMAEIEEEQPLWLVYFLASCLRLTQPQALEILSANELLTAQRSLQQALQSLQAGRAPAQEIMRPLNWVWLQGEPDDDDLEEAPEQVRALVEGLELPATIMDRVSPELEKLERFDPVLFEHQETLSRLEGLLAYPWHLSSRRPRNLGRLEKELDKAILGHQKVKEVLLDVAAAQLLQPSQPAPLLLLTGAAGLGKGTLLRALARGLGRPLRRLRLPAQGGADFLSGISRSLPGASPGAIYEAAVGSGVMDPLLHLSADGPLDEPTAAALLRLSDPATSSTFLEGYLGLPIDASRMLLVLDLPSADLLPAGLRERALELPLEGYAPSERLAILRDVLWPRAQRECGLRGRGVRLPDNVLEWLVKERTREAGVLELNKLAHQLARRLARRKLNGQASLEWSLEAVKACLGEAPPAPREAALE